MAGQEDFFDESKQKIGDYIKDRLLLLKLDAVEKGSKLVAAVFTILVISLFAFFVILFLSITAGYFLGEMLNHLSWGFGIVASIYIILLALIIIFRKKVIEKRMIDLIISIVFEKAAEELNDTANEQ